MAILLRKPLQAFRAIVGRQMRFIHALDVVRTCRVWTRTRTCHSARGSPPTSPVVLEDRPAEDISDLNWRAFLG